jgi:hypothetical protein
LLAAGLTLAAAVVASGALLSGPIGQQPDVTPQLRVVTPLVSFQSGQPIAVKVQYKNFDLQPQLRCSPAGPCTGSSPQTVTEGYAQGHIHVYFNRISGTGFVNVDSDSFCIPATKTLSSPYAGTVEGNCAALPRGVYRVSAEFQSNSHVSVLKGENKPQDAPTTDDREVVAR